MSVNADGVLPVVLAFGGFRGVIAKRWSVLALNLHTQVHEWRENRKASRGLLSFTLRQA
jgi:hypothetical protein